MSKLTEALEQSRRLSVMFQSVIDLQSFVTELGDIEQAKSELTVAVQNLREEHADQVQSIVVAQAQVQAAEAQADNILADAQAKADKLVADRKQEEEDRLAADRAAHEALVDQWEAAAVARQEAIDTETARLAEITEQTTKAEARLAKAEAKLASIRASIGA